MGYRFEGQRVLGSTRSDRHQAAVVRIDGDLVLPGAELAFLGWPLLPPVTYEGAQSLTIRFSQLAADIAAGDVSAWFAVEVGLVVVAIGLWFRHGLPGLPGANPRD